VRRPTLSVRYARRCDAVRVGGVDQPGHGPQSGRPRCACRAARGGSRCACREARGGSRRAGSEARGEESEARGGSGGSSVAKHATEAPRDSWRRLHIDLMAKVICAVGNPFAFLYEGAP